MSITLHYNATCGDCARKAQQTANLDWLNRVQISTEDSPIGQVPRGQIIVVENATQKVFTGVYGDEDDLFASARLLPVRTRALHPTYPKHIC